MVTLSNTVEHFGTSFSLGARVGGDRQQAPVVRAKRVIPGDHSRFDRSRRPSVDEREHSYQFQAVIAKAAWLFD